MRQNVFDFLNNRIFTLIVLLLFTIISVTLKNYSYFLGMAIVLLLLWSSHWNWLHFGITKPDWMKTAQRAIGWSVVIFIVNNVLFTPLIELYIEPIDLSGFEWLKGNVAGLIIFTLFMWVIAGFGEEILYRGYIMKQIAYIVGDNKMAWHIGAVLSSVLFGLAHLYQGPSGVITTGFVGLIFAYIFLFNPKNLILTMLIHGFYDMIGITFIYLDKES